MVIEAALLLAQVTKLDPDVPPLQLEASPMTTWIIAGVLVVGILLITFKTSKRNHLEKD